MRISSLTAVLLLSLPGCCHAASTDRPEASVLMAAVDSIPTMTPMGAPDARPVSPGVEALPEAPSDQLPGAPLSFYLFRLRGAVDAAPPAPTEPIEQMESPKYDDQSSLRLIQSSPLAGAAHRIRAERFNTADAVMDDFAICYRLTSRSSVQVIPGDPAPVKLPVVTMANNKGVTVGMVLKLSRNR